jgi:hypothetical protein
MAELLAVMALGEAIPGSVRLHLICDVADAWQSENFLRFSRSGKGYKEKGKVDGRRSVGTWLTGGGPLFDAFDIEVETHQPF